MESDLLENDNGVIATMHINRSSKKLNSPAAIGAAVTFFYPNLEISQPLRKNQFWSILFSFFCRTAYSVDI